MSFGLPISYVALLVALSVLPLVLPWFMCLLWISQIPVENRNSLLPQRITCALQVAVFRESNFKVAFWTTQSSYLFIHSLSKSFSSRQYRTPSTMLRPLCKARPPCCTYCYLLRRSNNCLFIPILIWSGAASRRHKEKKRLRKRGL